MPFVTQNYLNYLESLLGSGGGPRAGASRESSLPPPADLGDPFNIPIVPAGPPSAGGPGSYPAGGPQPFEGMYPNPIPVMSNPPPPDGGTYPVNISTPGGGVTPGPINDQFPLPTGGATPPPDVPPGLNFPGSETPVPPPPGAPGTITDIPGGDVPLTGGDQPPGGAPPAPPGAGDIPQPPGIPNIGGSIGDFFGNLGQFFNNIFNTDPSPNIAPSGSPMGSSTPDAQFPGIPLPGATVGGVGPGGSFGSPWQIYFGFHSPGFQAWMKQHNINPHEMLAALTLSGHGGSATTTGATQGAQHSGQQIHGV